MPPGPRPIDAIVSNALLPPTRDRSLLKFFLLLFAISIPFWLIGAVSGLQLLPGLPLAALAAVCPGTAALVLTYREKGWPGVKALLRRAFDCKRIREKIWYAAALFLMPSVIVLSYGMMRMAGSPVPAPQISLMPTLMMCVAFFVAASCEELGWSGYVIDRIQDRWGALPAAILVGFVWVVFHYVALIQAHRAAIWIVWWSLGTVSLRVIIVWLYNNTGGSVFAASLFHTTINVSWQLFPIHGSYFDPRVTGLITAFMAAVVTVTWGPKTLTRMRMPLMCADTTDVRRPRRQA
jgi:uncharacterized protein